MNEDLTAKDAKCEREGRWRRSGLFALFASFFFAFFAVKYSFETRS